MKNTITVLLLFVVLKLQGQTDSIEHFENGKTIQLEGVVLKGKTTTDPQKLLSFYKTNQSASLEEILSRLPEVHMIRRGAYGMEPTIRSFSSGQINVTIDGMRIHGACTDKMDPATIYIEPANLQTLELKTGNTGMVNGSNIGGSINFKMMEPSFVNPHRLNGSIHSGYQTAAQVFYESLMLNYATNKWAALANVTYRKANDYKDGDGNKVSYSGYEKLNYALSFHYKMPKMLMKIDYIGDDAFFIGYPALPMDVGYASARIGAVTFQQESSKKLQFWQAKLYANYIKHFMDDTQRADVFMHMDMPGTSKTFGFTSNATLRLNAKQKLHFIADASHTKLFASMTMYPENEAPMYMLTWPDNSRSQYGVGATWFVKPNKHWDVQLNSRVDHVQTKLLTQEAKNHVGIFSDYTNGTNDFAKNLSLQISSKFKNGWRFIASGGYVERFPTASEQYGFYLFNAGDGFDYIGSPNLAKEKAIQTELSLQKSHKRLHFKFTVHAARMLDYITGNIDTSFSVMTHGANGVKKYQNDGNALVTGVESNIIFQPITMIMLVNTFRYTYAVNDSGDPLPSIAPLKWISSVSMDKHGFTTRVEMELSSAQNRINPNSGEDKSPGFGLFHFHAAYKFDIRKNSIRFQTGVENIFNKTYHEHNDWGNVFRPGRNIYLQAKLNF